MIRYGELQYVSRPLAEVGMYNPKSGTDKDLVVVNFFSKEEDSLRKIEIFVEYMALKTYVSVSTSSYMDEDGYYTIFVELEKNEKTFSDILSLIKQFSNLTLYEEWNVHIYKKQKKKIKLEDIKRVLVKESK